MEKLFQLINENLVLFIVLCVVLIAVIIVIGVLVCVLKVKKKINEIDKEISSTISIIVECLGGKENIVSAEAKGSRLSVVLNDYTLLNEEKIKEQGVSSIIKMSTKVTLLVGSLSEEIASYINR